MFLAEATIQLVPDGTLLFHLLLIFLMVFILNRTLLKPINQILAERERQVTGRLAEAAKLAAEMEEKRRKYDEALHDARVTGYRLLERERSEGLKQREERLRQQREMMSKEVAVQIQATRNQEAAVKQELESQAASMSDLISSQILRRPGQ